MNFKVVLAAGAACAAMLAAAPAQAFGLRTHLYIADQIHQDLADCRLSLPGGATAAPPPDVCRAISAQRGAFLAGALGPDAFPDLLVGQVYVHPGTADGRQAADWLERVLRLAKTDREIAYAYGQMIHASGDIFAHTYVNNYAGDVFELTARFHKDVEERHFLLEKYIDQRLAYDAPIDRLDVPARLLVEAMVETSYLPGDVTLTPKEVVQLAKPNGPIKVALKVVGRKVDAAKLAAHMTALRAAIGIAERARDNAACGHANAEARLVKAFQAKVRAEADARGVPQPNLGAEPVLADCERDDAATVQRRLDAAQQGLTAAEAGARGLAWRDAPMNQRGAWLKTLSPQLRATLERTEEAYAEAAEDRRRARSLHVLGETWPDEVRKAAEAYVLASQDSARQMVRGGEAQPPGAHERRSALFPYEAWLACWTPVLRGGPAAAALATCERIAALQADASLSDVALRGALGDSLWRGLLFTYLDFEQWLDDVAYDVAVGAVGVVNPSAEGLINAIARPERVSRGTLDKAFQAGRNDQLKFTCVSDWIDVDLGLIPRPAGGLQGTADCRPRPGADAAPQTFDPARFTPIVHATTLGKLALLGGPEVQALAGRLGAAAPPVVGRRERYSVILDTARSLDGSHQWQGYSLPAPRRAGKDIKDEPVRSAGYPIARRPLALRLDPEIRDGREERPGFPFYQTEDLRRTAFAKLFPAPFEGEILNRPEVAGAAYPVRPCPGDPFRPEDASKEILCRTYGDRHATPDWVRRHELKALRDAGLEAAGVALETLDVDARDRVAALLQKAKRAIERACVGLPVDLADSELRHIPRPAGCLRPGARAKSGGV
jgi:hypothetical protein